VTSMGAPVSTPRSLHRWILAIGILGVTEGFYAAGRKRSRSWCEKVRDIPG
jgi:hypothetical protein